MVNFTFPGTLSNFSTQAILDLQQGVANAWNCTGTAICDSYSLVSADFTTTPSLIYIGNEYAPAGFQFESYYNQAVQPNEY